MCNGDIAVNQSAASETCKQTFFPGAQSETEWLVCLLPFAHPVSQCLGFFFFLCTQQKAAIIALKKARVPYHTEQEKRNLADRKAALPAVLSDFG